MDLNSSEKTYLLDLINSRLLDLQKNSFLCLAERVFIEELILKFGCYLNFEGGYYVVMKYSNSNKSDK